jgi:hypothetical protein
MSKLYARLIGFFIALALAGTVLAADAWRAKDYKQWDSKDVDKILNDSPWVKVVQIGKYWTTPRAPGATPAEGGPPPTASTGAASTYTVRWTSAVTMHHAVARNAELNKQGSTDDAEQYANAISDTYDIAVIGDTIPLGALDTTDAIAKVQQAASLGNKDAGQSFPAVKLDLGRGPDGHTVTAITFHFAKKNADGAPIFAPDAKGADFTLKMGKFDLKAHFDFTKMIGKNGLDL